MAKVTALHDVQIGFPSPQRILAGQRAEVDDAHAALLVSQGDVTLVEDAPVEVAPARKRKAKLPPVDVEGESDNILSDASDNSDEPSEDGQ